MYGIKTGMYMQSESSDIQERLSVAFENLFAVLDESIKTDNFDKDLLSYYLNVCKLTIEEEQDFKKRFCSEKFSE